eukprot:GILI01011577.1.p1 GENE.GILI01011577.1~~GILI01011577.1.p1  ORF type:complete len:172 (-),score=27.92 GILI01011577.1:503-1018(-)
MFANRLVPIASLSDLFKTAAETAVRSHKNAYAPYSNFLVGAALVHEDGTITPGANYENAILQSTCAERTAIVSANAKGYRRASAIAVYGRPADVNANLPADNLCPPCGLCRQFLVEVAQLSGVDLEIILVSFDTERAVVLKLSEILPLQFGPNDLSLDLTKWSNGCCDKKH